MRTKTQTLSCLRSTATALVIAALVTMPVLAKACAFHEPAAPTLVDLWVTGPLSDVKAAYQTHPGYHEILDTVVVQHAAWREGDPEGRTAFFATYTAHPAPHLRSLALDELDRTDYNILRVTALPEMPQLLAELQTEVELRPIRALLAGLSGDQAAVPVLKAELQRGIAEGWTYIGAYATALVELDGADGVAYLTQMIHDSSLSLETRELLIDAFAMHSIAGHPDKRLLGRHAATALLTEDPSLVGAVARQFGYRMDWSMAEPIQAARLLHPPTEIADIFGVNQYIGIALSQQHQ